MATKLTPTAAPILAYSRETGEPVALIASCSTPNVCHLVTRDACSCKGFQFRRTCRHLVAAPAAPAPVVAVEPELLRCCTCHLWHRTDADRIKAHPDANPLRAGGAAHLAVKRAAGEWPS